MADITLNFSSQWPSIQVNKVIAYPSLAGEVADYPYISKIPHNLGYPPLAIGFGITSATPYNVMHGLDVDSNYIYIKDEPSNPDLECAVIYALDISAPFTYTNYDSEIGDVLEDETGGVLDLRNFLLHSRAVSPMVLSVVTKDYTVADLTLLYTTPLNYPIFNFGYVRGTSVLGASRTGIWLYAPLAAQAWPALFTDGFASTLSSVVAGASLVADKGSIITLRNPSIITSNSVSVSI